MVDWQRLIPAYWFQNEPTSPDWDAALNEAISTGPVRSLSAHIAQVGPFEVWVANWPYAYGSLCGCDFLPKVATRKRLRKVLLESVMADARERSK